MRATAIIHPVPGTTGTTVISARDFDAVDEFVSIVAEKTGQEVPVLETDLSAAPADGYLLVFGDIDLSAYSELWPRIVLINADRSSVRKKLELGLAGAIEKHRYFQWRTERSREQGSGVLGLRTVAARIGARVVEGPYTTATYGWLSSTHVADLPSLLVKYLDALDTIRSGAES